MPSENDGKAIVFAMAGNNPTLSRMEQFVRSRLAEAISSGNRGRGLVPSVTISRECGAGIDQIGPRLVEYLSEVDGCAESGWVLFDQSLIGKIIEQHRLSNSVEPYLGENSKFPVVEALEEVLSLHPSQWSLFNYSADTVRKLCHLGNAVVVGRAGNFVASDLVNTFHTRLVGSIDRRIAHTADRYDIPVSRAREIVTETDKGRKKFVRRYTNSNIEDPRFYHFILNTDDFSVDGAARLLADSLVDWAHEKNANKKAKFA